MVREQGHSFGLIESIFYQPISWIALISIPANAQYIAVTLADEFTQLCGWIMVTPIAQVCIAVGLILFVAEFLWEIR